MRISKKYLSESGVTLLEVMIAVAIVSIALFSFISLVVSALQMEDYGRRVTEAALIADNRMKEIERSGFPELGETEGLIDEKDPTGFTYRQIVSETPINDVRQVRLDILWNKNKDSVTLEAYILRR
jgi:general secretion pathway protein I